MNNYVNPKRQKTRKSALRTFSFYPINKIITPVILLTRFVISLPQLTRDRNLAFVPGLYRKNLYVQAYLLTKMLYCDKM
jgi:hypothetical protein